MGGGGGGVELVNGLDWPQGDCLPLFSQVKFDHKTCWVYIEISLICMGKVSLTRLS